MNRNDTMAKADAKVKRTWNAYRKADNLLIDAYRAGKGIDAAERKAKSAHRNWQAASDEFFGLQIA